jgi:hypothetical protein
MLKDNTGVNRVFDLKFAEFIDFPDLGKSGYVIWYPDSLHLILIVDNNQAEREVFLYHIDEGICPAPRLCTS